MGAQETQDGKGIEMDLGNERIQPEDKSFERIHTERILGNL